MLTPAQRNMLAAIAESGDLESARALCKSFLRETEAPEQPKTMEALLLGLLQEVPYSAEQIQDLCYMHTGQSSPVMMLWVLPEVGDSFRQTLSHTQGFWCVQYQNTLVGLASGPEAADTIEALVQKHNLAGGMSRPFSDLANLQLYYQQALVTLQTARALGRNGLSFYDDFLMLRLFDGLREDVDVNDFALPDIQVLRDYDKQHDAELCKTLLCYLESSKNVSETAKKLHIHRNTVHYRIRKCQEMLPMLKFDEGYVYLLMLSLYIAQYEFYRAQRKD